jgi:hypothetical protein
MGRKRKERLSLHGEILLSGHIKIGMEISLYEYWVHILDGMISLGLVISLVSGVYYHFTNCTNISAKGIADD